MTMSRSASAAAAPIGVPASAARSRTRSVSASKSSIWLAWARSAASLRSSVAVTSTHASGWFDQKRYNRGPGARQAAACEPRERHRVARRRVGRVDRRHAGRAVVGVVHAVGAMEDRLGVGREDGIRAEGADLADEVLAEGKIVGQRTVGSVQERHPGVADHVGRGPLLRLADRRELERVEVRVLTALVAARAAHEPALGAFRDPAGTRRGGPKSASSGWAAMTMKRAGRQPWSRCGRSSVICQRLSADAQNGCGGRRRSVLLRPRLRSSPPRAKPPLLLSANPCNALQ